MGGYCVCNKGYYGKFFAPGYNNYGTTFYNSYGGGNCTACAAGKYYSQSYFSVHSTEAVVCSTCPVTDPYSQAGTTTCQSTPFIPTTCSLGQYLPSSSSTSCINCVEGTYKATTGTEACQSCPANSYSGASATAATNCLCNSGYDKVGIDPFVCQLQECAAGSTGPGGSCTLCAAGKYKAVTGSAACDDCAAGKYSAATGQSTCQNCLAGKFSAATGQSSSVTCQNCAAGTYASLPGSLACTLCPSDTYQSATGTSSCTQCPSGQWILYPSTIMLVPKYSPLGSTAISMCLPECNQKISEYVVASRPDCTCPTGYGSRPYAGFPYISCSPCETASWKSDTGIEECTKCEAAKYSTSSGLRTGPEICLPCPAFSTHTKLGSTSAWDCLCISGYARVAGQTIPGFVCERTCEPGFSMHDNLAGNCTLCPSGTYKSLIATSACLTCNPNNIPTNPFSQAGVEWF